MLELRSYQAEGLAAVWNYFQSGNTGNPLLAWPCGTGKSLVPAVFIRYVLKEWPNQRFLMITHVSTLISQNAEVLRYVWPLAPLGIYSAGLGYKQSQMPIVFGGIQSMSKHPSLFGHRDIIFIDEAHLVSQDESSMYLSFIATMKLINPNLKVIGMTATPFRMGMGLLTDGGLFTDIVHDLTEMNAYNRLIAEGYLTKIIPRRTHQELDVSNVGMAKGEFIATQLQSAVDKQEITYKALKEAVEQGHDRRSWLIFASGIEHSNHIAEMLQTFGIDCASVHSKQKPEYNDQAIRSFKDFRLRVISSFSKLTTGFNHPAADFLIDLRPTMSIPLHIQKIGRIGRPAEGKENALYLDFARNVPRLGPINCPIIPAKKGEKQGDAPIKICEACGTYNHAAVRFCSNCGHEFEFKTKIVAKSGLAEIIKSDIPIIEYFDVDRAIYTEKQKLGNPPYIRASYFCGLRMFNENVFPEHNGYPRKLFKDWWRRRHSADIPGTTKEALSRMSELKVPKKIKVWVNRKWPEIKEVQF